MAVQLGSAYGMVSLDATGVRRGAAQAEAAFLGLERRGGMAMAALGLAVGGIGAALSKVVIGSTRMSSDFQDSMVTVDLAAGDAQESFEELETAAMAVGGDTRLLGVSAKGAADAMAVLYKQGLSTTAMFGDFQGYMRGTTELGGAMRGAIDLAAASTLDMTRAADLGAVVLNTFGAGLETDAEKAEFINRALDNFVRAADASVAEVEDLAAGLVNIGPDAARLGFSIEDVNNALALLSTRGIKGAEAGTALKSMLLNLNRQTDDVTEALDELNVKLYDEAGVMRSLPDILGDLEDAFSGLTDEQRDHYMQTLAGTYGIKALSTLVAEGTEGWYAMADATARATGIQEQAARRAEQLSGRVEALGGNVETLRIRIGEQFLPVAEDLVEWAISLVDTHGPAVVGAFGMLADAVQWVTDGLQNQGTPLQNALTRMGTLSVAAGGVGLAYSKIAPLLAPAVTAVGSLFSDLYVKAQLLAGGAKLGEVAALGWSSTLVPVVAALAAVAAWLEVINRYRRIQQDVDEQTQETQKAWVGYLEDQVETQESAVGVARHYVRQQGEVNRTIQEGGIAAKLFIDAQEVANADTEALGKALVAAASDYEDYEAAVKLVNDALFDNVDNAQDFYAAYDRMVPVVSATTFELLRGAASMETGFIAARMLSEGVVELTEHQIIAQREAENSARVQENANRIAAASYLDTVSGLQQAGAITRQEAGSMRAVVVDEFGQIQTATENLQAAQARLAEVAATSWETFAQNVYAGVQEALAAYREGNAEMLAEQERALGQMVLKQAEQWAIMGKITPTQMRTIRAALHDEFGIMIDDASVGRDALLTLFAEMATGGAAEIDRLIEFIRNIGPETQQMAQEEREAIEEADAEWREFTGSMESYSAEMRTQFGTTLDLAQQVYHELTGLPKDHTFTLHLKTEGSLPSLPGGGGHTGGTTAVPIPEQTGTTYAVGGWHLIGELGPELVHVDTGAQVLTAQETASLIENAATLARSWTGAADTAAPEPRTIIYDQRRVEMTANVQDGLDMELLARRVAAYWQERGGRR